MSVPRVAESMADLKTGQALALYGQYFGIGHVIARSPDSAKVEWRYQPGEYVAIHSANFVNQKIVILEEPSMPTVPCVIRASLKHSGMPRVLFGHPNPGEERGMTFCRALDGMSYKRDDIASFEVLWEDAP